MESCIIYSFVTSFFSPTYVRFIIYVITYLRVLSSFILLYNILQFFYASFWAKINKGTIILTSLSISFYRQMYSFLLVVILRNGIKGYRIVYSSLEFVQKMTFKRATVFNAKWLYLFLPIPNTCLKKIHIFKYNNVCWTT